MTHSFIATIAFALLALGGLLLANLVVLVFTGSQWHVWGVVAAILAAFVSYWAQHKFTMAALYRDAGLTVAAEAAEMAGGKWQLGAVSCGAVALVFFIAGMWR